MPDRPVGIGRIEYKTIRQYQSMGDMLEQFRTYGYRDGLENIMESDLLDDTENGYGWLTQD
ncbi:MAG: hypothetical protein IME99_06475 [Proteobacteria bacterium]|nr:hypothetical protein [Pseudomonadota bacterium]